jgi:hypothetical protein
MAFEGLNISSVEFVAESACQYFILYLSTRPTHSGTVREGYLNWDIDTKKVCQISILGDALGLQYEPLLYFKIF